MLDNMWAYLTPTYVGLALLLVVLAILYVYVTYPFGYFELLGIPYPQPIPPFGNVAEIKRLGGLHNALLKFAKDYGNTYGIFFIRTPITVCGDPEKIQVMLVRNFSKFRNRPMPDDGGPIGVSGAGLLQLKNEDWKRVRATLSPTFSTGKLKQMYPLLQDAAKALFQVVEKNCKNNTLTNVNKMYENFTMDVIASTAFGIQLDAQNTPDEPFVINCRKVFQFAVENPFAFSLPFMRKLILRREKWRDMVGFWNTALDRVYNSRKGGKVTRNDLLNLMIAASEAEKAKAENRGTQAGMSDKEIKGNIFTFLLAGYETTSNALAFSTYLLALHQDVQDKLVAEIEKKLAGEAPTYDSVMEIPYLDAVLKEALRLYPPGFRFARKCNETCNLNGLNVSEGMTVMVPVFAIQRDPEFWENPEEFTPERFMPENEGSIKPFTYMPFGEGPRTCIGMRFAQLEVKLALALILPKYRMVKCEKTEVPLQLSGGITLTATNGVFIKFERR